MDAFWLNHDRCSFKVDLTAHQSSLQIVHQCAGRICEWPCCKCTEGLGNFCCESPGVHPVTLELESLFRFICHPIGFSINWGTLKLIWMLQAASVVPYLILPHRWLQAFGPHKQPLDNCSGALPSAAGGACTRVHSRRGSLAGS